MSGRKFLVALSVEELRFINGALHTLESSIRTRVARGELSDRRGQVIAVANTAKEIGAYLATFPKVSTKKR